METFLQNLLTLLGGGVGIWASTEAVKWAGKLEFAANRKAIIRSVAGGLSALGVVLTGLASGNLDPSSVQSLMESVVMIAGVWMGADLTHRGKKALKKE